MLDKDALTQNDDRETEEHGRHLMTAQIRVEARDDENTDCAERGNERNESLIRARGFGNTHAPCDEASRKRRKKPPPRERTVKRQEQRKNNRCYAKDNEEDEGDAARRRLRDF